MGQILSCYYLDEPLSEEECRFVKPILLGPWAKFKTGASTLVQKRVPLVLPLPDQAGHFETSPEQRAQSVCGNLRHAGIGKDLGRQVVWIMANDSEWDAVFQYAIRLETGFAPFVIQRWYQDPATLSPGQLRVINTQLLIQGLE